MVMNSGYKPKGQSCGYKRPKGEAGVRSSDIWRELAKEDASLLRYS